MHGKHQADENELGNGNKLAGEGEFATEGISDTEAAEWSRLSSEATKGPWVVDPDGSIGAPMAGFCGLWVVNANVSLIETDATFIAAARAAIPRLLAEREVLRAERDRARDLAARLEDELARLREGVEQLCAWIDRPLHERPIDAPVDLPELAEDLCALLADTDGTRPVAQCMTCGRDLFAGDALCCPVEGEGAE